MNNPYPQSSILRSANRILLPAIVVLPILLGAYDVVSIRAQSTHASSNLRFDVASVRQNKTDDKPSMNVDPTPSDLFIPTAGKYSAKNIVLVSYISFAYKLTLNQLVSVNSQVPWVAEERFDIEARAEGNPTKDEIRLMMQSLLTDRFKLAVRYETREVPVFGLKLAKVGKLGRQLRVHQPGDAVCSTPAKPEAPKEDAEGFPTACGRLVQMKPSAPGRLKLGGRGMTIAEIAASPIAVRAGLERPLLDQTGLKGAFDFTAEWILIPGNVPSGEEFHPDESAQTFQGALREQLGLRLVSQKGPSEFFIVDHIEQPSPN